MDEELLQRCRQDRLEAEGRQAAGRSRSKTGRTVIRLSDKAVQLRDDLLVMLVNEEAPMTVREVLYRLSAFRVIDKQSGYANLDKRLVMLRDNERIAPDLITDLSRTIYRPETWASAAEMLRWQANHFRREMWVDQKRAVWIGSEKDAISGVVQPITDEYDVPLVVTHGYTSISQVRDVVAQIDYAGKDVIFYQLGDHDPDGDAIPLKFQRRVRLLAPRAHIKFVRLAVTPEQIRDMNLQTRPTIQSGTRAGGWTGGESVDVDAIPPNDLRQLVRDHIKGNIDDDVWQATLDDQTSDRERLQEIANAA